MPGPGPGDIMGKHRNIYRPLVKWHPFYIRSRRARGLSGRTTRGGRGLHGGDEEHGDDGAHGQGHAGTG